MGETIVNGAQVLAAVTALVPEVRDRAEEIAAGRRLPDDLVESLKAAGAFRMPMPRSWDGPEMTPSEQLAVVETLATADPSTAWCVMIGSDAGYYSAFLDDAAGRDLFPDLDRIVAGWLMPAGAGRRRRRRLSGQRSLGVRELQPARGRPRRGLLRLRR